MKKFSVLIICSFFLTYFAASYAYKKGFSDSSLTTSYVTLAENYVALHFFSNKTSDESLKFYESMLASNIQIHRSLIEEKSLFHRRLDNGQHKPNLEYYKAVKEYVFSHPNKEFDESVIKDINWLVENEETIF